MGCHSGRGVVLILKRIKYIAPCRSGIQRGRSPTVPSGSTKVRWALLFAVLSLPLGRAAAQSTRHRTLRVALVDRTIEASVLNGKRSIDPKPGRSYHWCRGQQVVVTEGGLHGEVLDGPYTEFHPNGQLKAQGMLVKGLKHGAWKEWDAQGHLRSVQRWKAGRLHGATTTYLHDGNEGTIHRYRHGNLVEQRIPVSDGSPRTRSARRAPTDTLQCAPEKRANTKRLRERAQVPVKATDPGRDGSPGTSGSPGDQKRKRRKKSSANKQREPDKAP